ncbi:MAG: PEP-CTERM sorting domain-containing protein [Chlorobium sp.]|nr:MAG: PEP-CTERM sorting domain-containing protein [Chlorobium sp.]
MKSILTGVMALVIAVMSTSLHAEEPLINIKFGGGTYTGAAVAGTAGDTWNQFNDDLSVINQPVLLSTGTSAGSAQFSYTGGALVTGLAANCSFGATDKNLMRSYIYTSGSAGTMSFTGLQANKSYDLYVYTQSENTSGNNYGDGQILNLTVNGSALNQTTPSDGGASTFLAGQNYLHGTFTADNSGNLNISYLSPVGGTGAASRAVINGLQLKGSSPTPEPASLVLLGIGGLLASRKLKKKSAETSITTP